MSDARLGLAFGGLHPDRLAGLVRDLGGEPNALTAIRSGRVRLSDEVRAAILVPPNRRRRALERAGISFIERGDPGFPDYLGALPDAPPALFVRGAIPASPGVAVVGTRRCTAYGKRLAFAYGRAIAAAGMAAHKRPGTRDRRRRPSRNRRYRRRRRSRPGERSRRGVSARAHRTGRQPVARRQCGSQRVPPVRNAVRLALPAAQPDHLGFVAGGGRGRGWGEGRGVDHGAPGVGTGCERVRGARQRGAG